MSKEEFKDKIKHLNTEEICSVHLYMKRRIFGLEWKDEARFLGIDIGKLGYILLDLTTTGQVMRRNYMNYLA